MVSGSGNEIADGPGRKRAVLPYTVVSVAAGAAFAIIAMLNAPGMAYVIAAVVAAACYTMVGVLNRRLRD